jgi:hypothetical protein
MDFTRPTVQLRFGRGRKGSKGSMFRVRLIANAAILALGAALAGCSSTPSWMPDWMSSKPSPPPLVTLQFESDPPGAAVRTSQGQTCQTPCALAVAPESQAVTFSKNGFLPQTVQVMASAPADHSFFESAPPPSLTPNPVEAALQSAGPPPRPIAKPRPRRPAAASAPPPAAAPPPASEQPSPFPPPPRQ